MLAQIQTYIHTLSLPGLLALGIALMLSFMAGKLARVFRLPSLIGYMLIGVLVGPSFLDMIGDMFQEDLAFITEIALGLVAFTIGLELSMQSLRRLGKSIILIIFAESFGAFVLVALAVYLYSHDMPMALVFGAMAPASAPAGTVAVIQEFKAKGSLTKALYAVVGFDDGLAIIIFGFAAAFARVILARETGSSAGFAAALGAPFKEVILSLFVGVLLAIALVIVLRRLKQARDIAIVVIGAVFITNGLCTVLHLSLILTNMVLGFVIVNTQKHSLVASIGDQLVTIMALFFVLFFTLAGAHLHVGLLPSLGVLGVIYITARSAGLIGGSRLGAMLGKAEDTIKKYIGLGILSQAGVAIGLALIIKHEFAGLGRITDSVNGHPVTTGDTIGISVVTTITVTCIFFEIIGPVLTKIALKKAGDIKPE